MPLVRRRPPQAVCVRAPNHSSPEVSTIIAQHGFQEPLTTDQRLTAYRDHKKLNVIAMRTTPGGYQYELSTGTSVDEPDHAVVGLISLAGPVRETSRRARWGGCPICLETDTRIATPGGDVPVALIRPGDLVWTTDGDSGPPTATDAASPPRSNASPAARHPDRISCSGWP